MVDLSAGNRAIVTSEKTLCLWFDVWIFHAASLTLLGRFAKVTLAVKIRPDKVPPGPGPNGTLLMSRIPVGRG